MKKIFIIAEAGVNHNGSMENALKMIDIAADAGVDAVKFQLFKAENLVTKDALKAEYQIENSGDNESQFEMLKKLELNEDSQRELFTYCNAKGVEFITSSFDLNELDFVYKLGVPCFKIPSGEITNRPYIEKVGGYNKAVILSTGMCEMDEIQEAIDVLVKAGTEKEKITVLHCNTEYPTPFRDVNLKAMCTIGEEFGVKIGYSDHTEGVEVCTAAVALGAEVIEKHFTLDKSMEGPDHAASLNPKELRTLVRSVRNIEESLGSGIKRPSDSEKKNIPIVRKSIVAKKIIARGEILSPENITVKRPGAGISPMKWYEVIGSIAIKNFNEDEFIVL
jgi:N,N'-diacetyllegionaminate synthase